MGLKEIIQKAREKQALANNAAAKEARAQEKIRRAETKAQLERAKMELRIARMERKRQELAAKTALEKAKSEVDRARAAQAKASGQKWQARYDKAATITSPIGAGARAARKGLGRLAGAMWDEPKPKRRVATKKRKTTTKKRTSRTRDDFWDTGL